MLVEYDLGLNDNADGSDRREKGYLNLGIRWSFGEQLHLELDMKDILKNVKGTNNFSRELRIIYNSAFFTK